MFSRKNKENGKYYRIKVYCPETSFKLYFDSTKEAQDYKYNYQDGNKLIIPCSIDFKAIQKWEKHMDKPAEKKVDVGNVVSDLSDIAIGITIGILAESISPGSSKGLGDDIAKNSSGSWKKEVPAVYNYYDSFYLTCTIKCQSEYHLRPNHKRQ